MKFSCKKALLSALILFFSLNSYARDYLIYSISEEIPMGYENEKIKKNYYLNLGENQGIKPGTTVDVFRTISKLNPYNNQKRINYKVKVGELSIIHSDSEASIAIVKKFSKDFGKTVFEINNFMIGDAVSVNVN